MTLYLYWLLALLALCILGAACLNFAAVKARKDKPSSSDPPNDQTARVRLGARDEEIERLQARLDSLKWLDDLVEEQRKAIHLWVNIEGCYFRSYDLRRRSAPYIDFTFRVRNGSVFIISLVSLTGSIDYANEPLSGQVEWVHSASDLSPGSADDCVVRVLLERESAAKILNINSEFTFNRLKTVIKARPNVDEQVMEFSGRLNYKKLKEEYKGLEIEIDRSELRGRYDFTLKDEQLVAAFVDLHVTCVNPNNSQIVIEKFKFDANPALKRVASALTGSLQKTPHRYEDEHRHMFPEVIGPNLMDDCPIEAEQGDRIEGWLRFEFRNENPARLNGATPTLIAVDSLGIEHRTGCKSLRNEP